MKMSWRKPRYDTGNYDTGNVITGQGFTKHLRFEILHDIYQYLSLRSLFSCSYLFLRSLENLNLYLLFLLDSLLPVRRSEYTGVQTLALYAA